MAGAVVGEPPSRMAFLKVAERCRMSGSPGRRLQQRAGNPEFDEFAREQSELGQRGHLHTVHSIREIPETRSS